MLWDETDEIHSTTDLKDSNAIIKAVCVCNCYLVFPVCVAKQCVARPTRDLAKGSENTPYDPSCICSVQHDRILRWSQSHNATWVV